MKTDMPTGPRRVRRIFVCSGNLGDKGWMSEVRGQGVYRWGGSEEGPLGIQRALKPRSVVKSEGSRGPVTWTGREVDAVGWRDEGRGGRKARSGEGGRQGRVFPVAINVGKHEKCWKNWYATFKTN